MPAFSADVPLNPDPKAATRLEAYAHPDCGCPVEEWQYRGICLMLHFEPDGSLELLADAGEWDAEIPMRSTTLEAGRLEAQAWVDSLPVER